MKLLTLLRRLFRRKPPVRVIWVVGYSRPTEVAREQWMTLRRNPDGRYEWQGDDAKDDRMWED